MRKRSLNHNPNKIHDAWRMRCEGYTQKQISKKLRVPYWTLVDWFALKTRVMTNMTAMRMVGWQNQRGEHVAAD